MTLPPRRTILFSLLFLAALAGAYGAGRLQAPSRVVTQTQTVEVEKEKVVYRDRVVKGPVVVREKRVEVPGPAGPTVTVERVVERAPVVRETARDTATDTTTATATQVTQTRDYPRLTVGGGAGLPLSSPQLTWTALALYRPWDAPLSLGAQYVSHDHVALFLATLTF